MKRNNTIDVAKGFLILLVILGHILNYANLDYSNKVYIGISAIINSFHMSAFFMISGSLYNTEKWRYNGKGFLLSRLKSLILPFCVFEILGVFYHAFVLKQTPVYQGFLKMITFQCNVGADWFFPALFVASLCLWAISHIRRIWLAWVIVILLSMIPCFPVTGSIIQAILRGFMGLLFMWIGFQFRRVLQTNIKWYIAISCLVLLTLFSFLELKIGGADYFLCRVQNPFLFISAGVCGTISVFFISQLFSESTKYMRWIGKNSMIIVGTHQLVLYSIRSHDSLQWIVVTFLLILIIEILLIKIWDVLRNIRKKVLNIEQ